MTHFAASIVRICFCILFLSLSSDTKYVLKPSKSLRSLPLPCLNRKLIQPSLVLGSKFEFCFINQFTLEIYFFFPWGNNLHQACQPLTQGNQCV